MKNSYRIIRLLAAGVAALAFAGCRTYGEKHQHQLAERYYSGDIEGAAKFASKISEKEKDETTRSALLWHLEAGCTNLDAEKYEESMRCLNRAEKLFYMIDSSSSRFHEPGMYTYRGTHSDRLLLHLLKGFNYLAEDKLEDFLVEIRRLRAEQFRYVFEDADPEIRAYEARACGNSGVPPLAMRKVLEDSDKSAILRASGLSGAYNEYTRRRRSMLPLMYNPLGFYLSALGYSIDNEYEEAVIDFRYLLMLAPGNRLYRQDFAALTRALGDQLPAGFEKVEQTAVPADQTVCFIVARGRPDGWETKNVTYKLPGKVPTDWSFSYPVYSRIARRPGFAVFRDKTMLAKSSHLADLSDILNEEFWQISFPRMISHAYAATVAMTVAHEAAKASLVAAMAMPNNDVKPIIVASAQAAVIATSRAIISETEWRRWVTLPRSYSVAHVQLPGPGESRKMTLVVKGSFGNTEKFDLDFSPDANRAVVYVREVNSNKYVLKKWESME